MVEKVEVESVDDPLAIHHVIENSNVCEDFKEEINEEETNSVENNVHGVNNVIDSKDKEVNYVIDNKINDNINIINENSFVTMILLIRKLI